MKSFRHVVALLVVTLAGAALCLVGARPAAFRAAAELPPVSFAPVVNTERPIRGVLTALPDRVRGGLDPALSQRLKVVTLGDGATVGLALGRMWASPNGRFLACAEEGSRARLASITVIDVDAGRRWQADIEPPRQGLSPPFSIAQIETAISDQGEVVVLFWRSHPRRQLAISFFGPGGVRRAQLSGTVALTPRPLVGASSKGVVILGSPPGSDSDAVLRSLLLAYDWRGHLLWRKELDTQPSGFAVDPNRLRVYLCRQGGDGRTWRTEIIGENGKAIARFDGPQWWRSAFAPDGASLVVLGSTVGRVSLAGVTRFNLGTYPKDLVITSAACGRESVLVAARRGPYGLERREDMYEHEFWLLTDRSGERSIIAKGTLTGTARPGQPPVVGFTYYPARQGPDRYLVWHGGKLFLVESSAAAQ